MGGFFFYFLNAWDKIMNSIVLYNRLSYNGVLIYKWLYFSLVVTSGTFDKTENDERKWFHMFLHV